MYRTIWAGQVGEGGKKKKKKKDFPARGCLRDEPIRSNENPPPPLRSIVRQPARSGACRRVALYIAEVEYLTGFVWIGCFICTECRAMVSGEAIPTLVQLQKTGSSPHISQRTRETLGYYLFLHNERDTVGGGYSAVGR